MPKKVKPIEFDNCITVINFSQSENLVSVEKTHYDKDCKVLSRSIMAIPLNSNTFETAMQIASAIASNVGLVEYEG